MDMMHLKVFIDLTKTMHFGKTSRNCYLTPSSVTRVIQRLEDQVGAPLFRRDNRSVDLTKEGLLFKRYCEDHIQRWEMFQQDIHSETGTVSGLVRLYCSVTASHSILSTILDPIKSKYPEVIIHLETGPSEATFQKIRSDEADIGIASFSEHIPEGFIINRIQDIPLCLIVPKGQTLDAIVSQKLPFIYPKSGLSKKHVDAWFRAQKINPRLYTEIAGFDGIMCLVSLGYGAGVVPQLVLETNPLKTKVDALAIKHPIQGLRIGVCCKKKRNIAPNVSIFMQGNDR